MFCCKPVWGVGVSCPEARRKLFIHYQLVTYALRPLFFLNPLEPHSTPVLGKYYLKVYCGSKQACMKIILRSSFPHATANSIHTLASLPICCTFLMLLIILSYDVYIPLTQVIAYDAMKDGLMWIKQQKTSNHALCTSTTFSTETRHFVRGIYTYHIRVYLFDLFYLFAIFTRYEVPRTRYSFYLYFSFTTT